MNGTLRNRIKNGEVVLGIFYKLNSPTATEIIGWSGVDFIVADCEHSAIGYESAENIVRAGEASGLATVIRVPCASEEHIFHALDSGAAGVQIPNITTVEQCQTSVSAAKYFPLGTRGLSRQTRNAMYGIWKDGEQTYTETANEASLVVVHIENREMVEEIEAICQLPQVDVVFIGPADLSQSLGIPGKTNDPQVVALAEKVIETANRHGKCAGINVTNQSAAQKYVKMGARYILYSSDTAMLAKGLQNLVKEFEPIRRGDI